MSLKKVAAFELPWQAHLFKGFLESEGVQAYVVNEEHIRLYWPISNALGGVRVMVHAEDLEHAKSIYQQYLETSFEDNLQQEFPDYEVTKCDYCGSEELEPLYSGTKTLLFFLAIGPAPGKLIGYRCLDCNAKNSL
ncbi:putative signal transducing protein [Kangiella sediminilitoris]|uniref:DUF2007 domain-containing protein n=1 Tax=Kangiella sediminilitoris TaxID=1144748 RepID=A0A1B3BBQ4_9GAMM|nr:DUF2007 domain-containing protein [Kangiella sediminilitoris]AOE50220.1 hypothetical protein KS2013_1508 [Kangiella sediminilitoris]